MFFYFFVEIPILQKLPLIHLLSFFDPQKANSGGENRHPFGIVVFVASPKSNFCTNCASLRILLFFLKQNLPFAKVATHLGLSRYVFFRQLNPNSSELQLVWRCRLFILNFRRNFIPSEMLIYFCSFSEIPILQRCYPFGVVIVVLLLHQNPNSADLRSLPSCHISMSSAVSKNCHPFGVFKLFCFFCQENTNLCNN